MMVDLAFIAMAIISFIGFIIAMYFHKKHITEILEIEDYTEIGKAKYMRLPFLVIANFLIGIGVVFLTFAIGDIQSSSEMIFWFFPAYYYSGSRMQLLLTLAIIIILLFSIYPIITNKKKMIDWVVYLLWFGIGLGSIHLYYSPYSGGFEYVLLLIVVSGIVFLFTLGDGHKFTLGIVLTLVFGSLLGVGFWDIIWRGRVPLVVHLIAIYFIIVYLIIKREYGREKMLVGLFGFTLLFSFTLWYWTATWCLLWFTLGQAWITKQFKKSICTILTRWIYLSMKQKGSPIELGKHEYMPDFSTEKISEESNFFYFLENTIIRCLEKEGFDIEINVKDGYVNQILVGIKD